MNTHLHAFDPEALGGTRRPADGELERGGIRLTRDILRLIFDSLYDAVFIHDLEGRVLDVNAKMLEMYGVDRQTALSYGIQEGFSSPRNPSDKLPHIWFKVIQGEEQFFEWIARRPLDGSEFYVEVFLRKLPLENRDLILAAVRDITERKKIEEKLTFISLHDGLTGLYNRAYFQQEMYRLEKSRVFPVGIIVCDLDGLKLVNDTLGHNAGDRMIKAAARIVKGVFRSSDVVARIGGDEFAVLISQGSRDRMEDALLRIHQGVEDYNAAQPEMPLSISAGYSLGEELPVQMDQLFKEADHQMYHVKTNRSRDVRQDMVHVLFHTLEERDFDRQEHGERLQRILSLFAERTGFAEEERRHLRLLARYHDIGKVGIPETLLNKETPLSSEEFAEVKRHCEIGFRIAQVSPELMPIADWILKHHEWWNGQGYPMGLSGEEIPLACRMMAIADAYEAMTSKRPQRDAIGHEQALECLMDGSGTQFDPELTQVFIALAEEKRQYFE